MNYNQGDLEALVANTFKMIKSRNRSFSLRAYSQRIGLPPSVLSEIMNRKKKISPLLAKRIYESFKLNPKKFIFVSYQPSSESLPKEDYLSSISGQEALALRKSFEENVALDITPFKQKILIVKSSPELASVAIWKIEKFKEELITFLAQEQAKDQEVSFVVHLDLYPCS